MQLLRRLGFWLTRVLLITLASTLSGQADEEATPPPAEGSLVNPGFEDEATDQSPVGWMTPKRDGYRVSITEEQPGAGKRCAIIESEATPEASAFGNLMQAIDATPFRGQRVRFRGAVRTAVADKGNQAQLWFRVDRRSEAAVRAVGAFDNMADRPITHANWQYYDIVGDVDDDADQILVGLILSGRGKAWIDDVSLEVVGKEIAATARPLGASRSLDHLGPGIFEVTGSMRLAPNKAFLRKHQTRFKSGAGWKNLPVTVLIPLPLAYRDQIPLGYEIAIDPPHAADSFETYEDKPQNYVVRLVLADALNREEINVKFGSAILVGESMALPPEGVSVPVHWPDEATPWLQATWCVDAGHERIQEIGKEIRQDTDDVMQIVSQIEQKAKQIFRAADGRVKNLTAVEALDKRGSCTSCANLVAALLRGAGVPARVLAGYPSWSGPLQTHYLVEAYVPTYGWYPIESTLGRSPWPNSHQIHVAIIPPEYEEKRLARQRSSAAGGVPYLSLTELPDNLGAVLSHGTINGAPNCDHLCKMLRRFEAQPAEWKQAIQACQPRWKAWLNEGHTLSAEGKASFGTTAPRIDAKSLAELMDELQQR